MSSQGTRSSLACLLLAICLSASVTGFASPAPEEDRLGTDAIDRLAQSVELPGERGVPTVRPPDAELGQLIGKTVTRVTAIAPPAGFSPVEDADIPLGIVLTAAVVRRAVLTLWESGNYRDVQVFGRAGPGGGAELLIEVQPMLRLRRLKISGNVALDDDEIARAVDYAPDRTIFPDPEVLRQLRQQLLQVYGEQGYRESSATLRIETTTEPGGVALVIDVEEGSPERYERVRLPGLPQTLFERRVVSQIGLKAGTVRNAERVAQATQELVEHLAEHGYWDARVEPAIERRIDRYSIALEIPIRPGVRTGFSFRGNRHFRDRTLFEQLTAGQLFRSTPDSLEQGLERLKTLYRTNGFFHVRLSAARACLDHRQKVVEALDYSRLCSNKNASSQEIIVTVREGPTVEVADVWFRGNAYFTSDRMYQELMAFMTERSRQSELFQPFSTSTINDLGLSDNRPAGTVEPRDSKAPRPKKQRFYIPKLYEEAMDHLTDLYKEQGFLSAVIIDTCDLSATRPFRHKNMHFSPITISRESEDAAPSDRPTPCVFINDDRDHLLIRVTVNEGPQTQLDEIRFEGNTVMPSQTLLTATGLMVSSPYNAYSLRESSRTIRDLYRSQGYMFAEVSWTKTLSPDARRARVIFTVEEGSQVRAGNIRIEGTEVTSKSLIRERLTLSPGDLVTPEAIEKSQQSLIELGVFQSAVIEMISPEVPTRVKQLRVKVTEGDAQFLQLSPGIATVEGLRGGFEYGYRNLGGWAINVRFRSRANYRLLFDEQLKEFQERWEGLPVSQRLEYHVLAGTGQPHLPGTKGLIGWDVDAILERLNEPAFSATRWTAFLKFKSVFAFGSRFRRGLVIEPRTGIENSTIDVPIYEDDIDWQQSAQWKKLALLPQGESTFWVTGLKFTVDLRDHPFNPSRGLLFSIAGDYVKSLDHQLEIDLSDDTTEGENQPIDNSQSIDVEGESNLIRGHAILSGYIPLLGTEMVLALSASLGYVFHLQSRSQTWADRYFYAGGVDTLRGFSEESLVPEDVFTSCDENPACKYNSKERKLLRQNLGGDAMLILRAEFRFPLASGLYGAAFTEAGNVWRDVDKMKPFAINPLAIHLRPVTGGGLRLLTPIGPLSFDLGFNLDPRFHEEALAWFLSFGTAI